ncbi:hypothetical protein [Desulfatitalea alkaliphila]|uniref:Uncharacterized protein n=1 Tax=Desulfatitalea alkaliphila TaxID=2929485 RepID=A0AA41UIJ0_9BACT|nr:hypothetical protein [Desulfatitalea alkaliphila]MCJ8500144.1 hypothetical protein [Desulfatitalea alkaliphila]
MITLKSPNQLYIFDPWVILSPKRRQTLDTGWPGLFREDIMPTLPVDQIITEDADSPVELKAPKQIVSDSLHNPSDPDATVIYSNSDQ